MPAPRWTSIDLLAKELQPYAHDGRFPRRPTLVAAARWDLINAIDKFGGWAAVAAHMDLAYRPRLVKASKAEELRNRLMPLVRRFGRLPTNAELSTLGEAGLAGAISRLGGFRAVAAKLDFLYEQPKPRSSRKGAAYEALRLGTAGEHLACADLLARGYQASLVSGQLPYDILLDDGGRMWRVQVKTTTAPKPLPQRQTGQCAYVYHPRRAGKAGSRVYAEHDFDLVAFVALDIKAVGYLPLAGLRQIQIIQDPRDERGQAGAKFEELDIAAALSALQANHTRP